MAVRGWIGYSRRWWGGQQDPPSPVEVIDVGQDESDGGALRAFSARVVPGGGLHAAFRFGSDARDFFVEQIVSDSTQGLLLRVEPINPPPTVNGAHPRLRESLGSGNFASGALVPDATEVEDVRAVIVFERPGLSVSQGQQLRVMHTQPGTNTSFTLWYREAA